MTNNISYTSPVTGLVFLFLLITHPHPSLSSSIVSLHTAGHAKVLLSPNPPESLTRNARPTKDGKTKNWHNGSEETGGGGRLAMPPF